MIPQLSASMMVGSDKGPAVLDVTAPGNLAGSAITRSFSHTTTKNTSMLVVVAHVLDGAHDANNMTACSFNGVAMTQATSATISQGSTNSSAVNIYFLANPPVGTFSVSLTARQAANLIHTGEAFNLTGVNALHLVATSVAAVSASFLEATIAPTLPCVIIGGATHISTSAVVNNDTWIKSGLGNIPDEAVDGAVSTTRCFSSASIDSTQGSTTIRCTASAGMSSGLNVLALAAFRP